MKKILLFLLSLLIGTAIFSWTIHSIGGWMSFFKILALFTGWSGLFVLIITFLEMFVGVWKWQTILKSQGVNIRFRDLSGGYFGDFFLTYLVPTIFFAGETFRGYLLKKKYQSLSWEKTLSSIILDRLIDSSIILIAVVAGVLYFLYNIGLPPENLTIFFGIALFLFIATIAFFYFKCFKKESIIKSILNIFGFKELKENNIALGVEKEIFSFFHKRKYFSEVILISVLRNILLLLRQWLLILFLGGSISLFGALSIFGFSYLASLPPIPANLGSYDAIQSFVFMSLKMPINMGIVFSMIIRAAEIAMCLVGAVALFRFGYKIVQLKLNSNEEYK